MSVSYLSAPTSSQSTWTDSKWHSSRPPPRQYFPLRKSCVWSSIYRSHTHIGCCSNIGLFQVDSCFKAAGYGEGPSRVLPPTLGLWVRESGPPSVGLIEGRASICLSQKGDWLPASAPAPLRFSWKPFRLAQLGMLAHQIPGFSEKCKHRPDFSF